MNCRKGGAKITGQLMLPLQFISDSDKTDIYRGWLIAMTHMLLEAADLGLGAVEAG